MYYNTHYPNLLEDVSHFHRCDLQLVRGDGVADIAGRRFGHVKLPHNPDKSYAGSIAMFFAGFIASILFMCYFHLFGFVEQSWTMVAAFGITSLAAAIVESLPVSTLLDDNLTTSIASALVGGLVFYYVGGGGGGDGSSILATAAMVFAGSS